MPKQLSLRFADVPVTCPAQKRYHAIAPCLAGQLTASQQATVLNISDRTVHRWLRQFRADRMPGLFSASEYPREMLKTAQERDFAPACVVFDGWYSSLENLKTIQRFGWVWLTRLKCNRLVNPDNTGLRPVSTIETDARGCLVHLKGFGLIRLFKIVAPDGTIEWWASRDVQMSEMGRVKVRQLRVDDCELSSRHQAVLRGGTRAGTGCQSAT